MIPARRSALLIDDEPLARLELRRLLMAHPDVQIVGEAATMIQAKELLGRTDYDLVFLDVQLRGGNGFDLLDSVAANADIVFITAYDQYAVRAFEVNAVDYLLKPVTAERLARALLRVSGPADGPPEAATRPVNGRKLTSDDRVFVRSGKATRFLPLAKLAAIRSCENYTELLLAGGEKLLVLRSLKSWEEQLPEQTFVRVHRQTIVNLQHVRQIVRTGEDEVLFELTPPLPSLPASRRQTNELRHRFAAAGLDRMLP